MVSMVKPLSRTIELVETKLRSQSSKFVFRTNFDFSDDKARDRRTKKMILKLGMTRAIIQFAATASRSSFFPRTGIFHETPVTEDGLYRHVGSIPVHCWRNEFSKISSHKNLNDNISIPVPCRSAR